MASNTWDPGPQQLTQVVIDDGAATTINASLIEDWSLETEKDAYDAAAGFSFDRGFTTKTGGFNCMDYAAVAALEGMMTDRDVVTITSTYADSTTQAVSNATIQVSPLVNLVPDVCNVYIAAQGTSLNSLTGSWTDLGLSMSEPTFTFEYPFDGTDGCGRPYFGGLCRGTVELELPGIRGATTDIYSAAYAFEGVNVDIALTMPNGKFLVFKNMYAFVNYGAEDASGVRTVHLRLTGVATAWSSMLSYTDGGVTAAETTWGTTASSQGPGNKFSGCSVSFVGTDYVEDDGAGGGVTDWTSA